MAIIPSKQGRTDKVTLNDTKNLIICPMPYDQSFVEIFYQGWNIVKFFLNADAQMPKESNLFNSLDRLVCKELVNRRNFPVLDVIEALEVLKQPQLIQTTAIDASIETKSEIIINKIIAPSSFYK